MKLNHFLHHRIGRLHKAKKQKMAVSQVFKPFETAPLHIYDGTSPANITAQ